MKLDKTKIYGTTHGVTEDNHRYVQNGVYFLQDGTPCPGQEKAIKAAKSKAGTASTADLDSANSRIAELEAKLAQSEEGNNSDDELDELKAKSENPDPDPDPDAGNKEPAKEEGEGEGSSTTEDEDGNPSGSDVPNLAAKSGQDGYLNSKEVKALVNAAGGDFTSRKAGIAFLEEQAAK